MKENITKRKTFLFIIIAWILAICATIPWFLGLDLDGSVLQKCKVKAEYKEALKLHSYIFKVFIYGVALVVMSIFYGQVIKEFVKQRSQVIEQNRQVAFPTKKRIIAMLISVIFIFAILVAVGTAFQIVYWYTPGSFAGSVLCCLVLINSSIN